MESTATIRYATAGGAEVHAVSQPDGEWAVRCGGCDHAPDPHPVRAAALRYARQHAHTCTALPQDAA